MYNYLSFLLSITFCFLSSTICEFLLRNYEFSRQYVILFFLIVFNVHMWILLCIYFNF